MKLFEKIKSLFRAKSLAEVEAADNRRSAKRLKTMMDKFDRPCRLFQKWRGHSSSKCANHILSVAT